ncbi:hypothetical protein AVEN_96123-1 [Araneus ventricosus]|uniref:Uncharacterized protein n=1 Tax=Araneus ventricosus TaxID=182803 RepID=A0A4Y2CAA3_ARAVE|nr:hypothetical protein AVEN_96123-1 [Araneus ventricosus]
MTRTTSELAPPSPNFRATPTGGRLATTYDLACNRPHTRRIFSGIGFRTCDPPVPRLTLPLGHRGSLYNPSNSGKCAVLFVPNKISIIRIFNQRSTIHHM